MAYALRWPFSTLRRRPPLTPGGLAGLTIAQFEVGAEIGRGGMGIVYEARDVRLDRPVALKALCCPDPSASELQCVSREAGGAARLRHAFICRV